MLVEYIYEIVQVAIVIQFCLIVAQFFIWLNFSSIVMKQFIKCPFMTMLFLCVYKVFATLHKK